MGKPWLEGKWETRRVSLWLAKMRWPNRVAGCPGQQIHYPTPSLYESPLLQTAVTALSSSPKLGILLLLASEDLRKR